jgi:hypothetical protein
MGSRGMCVEQRLNVGGGGGRWRWEVEVGGRGGSVGGGEKQVGNDAVQGAIGQVMIHRQGCG